VFSIPILAGLARYSDIYELTFEDFIVMNEILIVKYENEHRAQKHAERSAKKR